MEKCRKRHYTNGKVKREMYHNDVKVHRENLPAIIGYFLNGQIEYEKYFLEGKYHRENGPAIIYYFENGKIERERYYLDNTLYSDKVIIDNWEAFCKMQIFR